MAAGNEKAIEKAVEAIEERIGSMSISVKILPHQIAIAAGVAAGIGAAVFAICSKIEEIKLQKEYETMCREISENEDKENEDKENEDKENEDEDYEDRDDSVMRLPYGLEKNPEKIEEYESNSEIISQNGYSGKELKTSDDICPAIEIHEEIYDFWDRLDGYKQYMCTFFYKSGVTAYFDEAKEEFVEVNCEAVNQAMEFLEEHYRSIDTVYVADHLDDTVYEVSFDDRNTLEEVIDDARV